MLRRSLIIAAFIVAAGPSIATAQNNHLQAAFEYLGNSDRRAAQEQLQEGGFYSGAIDGRYGNETQSALTGAARFIDENSYHRVHFDLSSSAGAQQYITALARGDLGKYLFGEGDESDF